MKTNWNYPTSLWVGENRVKDLTLACQNLKIKKPLFVTDKDLINLPIVKNIISELENSFNQINVFSNFSGITTNPTGNKLINLETNFVSGLSDSEINKGSGEIVYLDNRPLIVRNSRQKEDIKIILEF